MLSSNMKRAAETPGLTNGHAKKRRAATNTLGLKDGHAKKKPAATNIQSWANGHATKKRAATHAPGWTNANAKKKRAATHSPGLTNGHATKKRVLNTRSGALTSPNTPELKEHQGILEDAKIIVGVDFGTTFSGFAFASMDAPEKIMTYYEWPGRCEAHAQSYCKTQTSLWYVPGKSVGTFHLGEWGWPAQVSYSKSLQEKTASLANQTLGSFFTKFKLYLADADASHYPSFCKVEKLPEGLSAERMITDYLRLLSILIMEEVRNRFGRFIRKKDIKWCLSVPTIWTDTAKQTMLACSQRAGLVQGPHCSDEDASLHKIELVLEAEAASIYCQQALRNINPFRKGSKFLVVDAGGGTVDLVVHEKLDNSSLRVKEVTRSTGDLCGGTFVDAAFRKYLARKIDCLETISKEFPHILPKILSDWEKNFKYSFDGYGQDLYDLDLPAKLSNAWVAHQKRNGSWTASFQYDAIMITREDMKTIFDGEVKKILRLIKHQLEEAPEIEAIMVVGGFSNSRYLMRSIRDRFLNKSAVKDVSSPLEPGSAVYQGAVTFGALGPEIMMSRISRKTYGISMYRPFQAGDPPGSNVADSAGKSLCKDAFGVFTRIGNDVPVNHCVHHNFLAFDKGETDIKFTVYSTTDPEPKFVTDTGVQEVGSWRYTFPPEAQRMKDTPSSEVAMYFGRTHIEMSAKPINFSGMEESMHISVLFEKDLV